MSKIFISYRRDDSADVCGRITDHLIGRFGKSAIFKDVDSLHGGEQFPARLQAALQQCDIALVVIGRQWLTIPDAAGRRRLDDPGDFVRYEVEQLLRRGIAVIPVLVQQAALPAAHELPPALAALSAYPPVVVRPDPYFRQDVQSLASTIAGLLRAAASKRQRVIPHPWLLAAALIGLVSTSVALILNISLTTSNKSAAYNALGLAFFVSYFFVLIGAPFQAIQHKQWPWLALLIAFLAVPLVVSAINGNDLHALAITEVAAFAVVGVFSAFGPRIGLLAGF